MPANLPVEWYVTERKYLEAKTLEEKIFWLEKLISITPKHKGTENLLADLRKRLSKLKSLLEKKSKKVGGYTYFKKVGSVLISFLGIANSGKSYWINKLCNTNLESSEKEYETKEPKSGIYIFEGIEFQLVEIPSFFLPKHMWIAKISDANVFLINNLLDIEFQIKTYENIIKDFKLQNVYFVLNNVKNSEDSNFFKYSMLNYEKLFIDIWNSLNKIRIFTKPPGKEISQKALILDKNSTVLDAINEIDERLKENFKFCIIIRNGKEIRAGLNFVLEDKDIIEIRTKI
ncbi:MAG: TGS domain-containing protein [Candidatus Aenigmatarchaeota archaeon]